MTNDDPTFHLCDDWISVNLPDRELILAAQHILSVGNPWIEIVPGFDSIAVQFDPALLSPDSAVKTVLNQLSNLAPLASDLRPAITIPVCYEPRFAPDLEYIADKLSMNARALPSWHKSQTHRVAMLGFMPGFAYLESAENCPTIGRLSSPRQLVAAGSIGIIGGQSCVYSFDSPGGWPIIGRTPLHLFDPDRTQPNLLSPGQVVQFEPITEHAFADWHRRKTS